MSVVFTPIKDTTELKDAILSAWQAVAKGTINNLINSLQNRIFSVLNRNGDYIKKIFLELDTVKVQRMGRKFSGIL